MSADTQPSTPTTVVPACLKCGARAFVRDVPTVSRTQWAWSDEDGRYVTVWQGEVDDEDSVATVQCERCGAEVPSDYLEAYL